MPVTEIVAITAGVLAYAIGLAYLLSLLPLATRPAQRGLGRALGDPRVIVLASLPVPAFLAFLALRAALVAG